MRHLTLFFFQKKIGVDNMLSVLDAKTKKDPITRALTQWAR